MDNGKSGEKSNAATKPARSNTLTTDWKKGLLTAEGWRIAAVICFACGFFLLFGWFVGSVL